MHARSGKFIKLMSTRHHSLLPHVGRLLYRDKSQPSVFTLTYSLICLQCFDEGWNCAQREYKLFGILGTMLLSHPYSVLNRRHVLSFQFVASPSSICGLSWRILYFLDTCTLPLEKSQLNILLALLLFGNSSTGLSHSPSTRPHTAPTLYHH